MADFTIVGGGLAGCSLAIALHKRGKNVRVVDRGDSVTSTKVAAGIVNPITGPYLTKGLRFNEYWSHALKFYRSFEGLVGRTLFREMRMVRLLDSEQQVTKWQGRLKSPSYQECLTDDSFHIGDEFHSEFGGFTIKSAGHLLTTDFIEATKRFMGDQWQVGEIFEPESEGVTIFCEGVNGLHNPLFDWVHFRPAKGEILTVRINDLNEDRIVNRGRVWLLPIGDGVFRAGATYDWDSNDCNVTTEGRELIELRLKGLIKVPYEVLDQRAAVRPVIGTREILIGIHPGHEHVGFFNGLGSKGVLLAPFFAENFAAHLCGEAEIDEEANLRGNL